MRDYLHNYKIDVFKLVMEDADDDDRDDRDDDIYDNVTIITDNINSVSTNRTIHKFLLHANRFL